ncbi:MAG: methylenetetrahydrofolate reductase [Actinobacteria bacterium]|nr:MAG: methylenetetrahydrofolate reductase [Actinomycetota bacterium]
MSETPGHLGRILRSGRFCVTAEVVPPRSADPAAVVAQAKELVGYADAVNVTDNPASAAHMAPLAGVAVVADAGIEPILQLTCRDRNRLALTADLLGGWALGARAVLCLSGDPAAQGDHPDAKEVYDLTVLDLVGLAAGLRDEGRLLSGATIEGPPRYLIGVADLPLAAGYDPTRLEAKISAGADFVQTQIVYDVEAFTAWADGARSRGVFDRVAVIAGVAPLRNARQARLVASLPGVSVPADVLRALEEAGADAETEGTRLAILIVNGLREIPGLAGVHLMGLGQESAVRRVVEGAGLLPRPVAAP